MRLSAAIAANAPRAHIHLACLLLHSSDSIKVAICLFLVADEVEVDVVACQGLAWLEVKALRGSLTEREWRQPDGARCVRSQVLLLHKQPCSAIMRFYQHSAQTRIVSVSSFALRPVVYK